MGSMKITLERGTRFRIETRGKTVYVDQPPPEGEDSAMTPLELFVASFGACMAYFATIFLKRRGVNVEGVSFTLNYERVKDPYRVSKIEVVAELPEKIDETAIKGAVRSALNCPVHNSIKNPIDISFSIKTPE